MSPYDRYPDTAIALSQLAIKPRLHANQRESEWETTELKRVQIEKELGSSRQRVGILCNPTHMWFILLVDTKAAKVQLFPHTVINVNNPQTSDCTKTLGCCQKYQLATRNTDHSWPTYSHLIMLAHYTRCNMALHPLAHATVSNNAGLFQQSEYIYSWRPLIETPAFQSSLAVSSKKTREGRRAREIKGEREVRASSSPQLKWTVHSPLRAGLLSNMACEWDSSLSSLPHINSSDCESSASAAMCDRYSDI